MVFHWNLSDSKSPQVSLTFLNIMADLNKAVVWMVSSCSIISKSSSPFTNPIGVDPSAPTSIGINIIFMIPSFSSSQAKSRYLSFFSLLSNFTLWQSSLTSTFSVFCKLSLGLVVWPRFGEPFVYLNLREIFRFILKDGSWNVYISHECIVKF